MDGRETPRDAGFTLVEVMAAVVVFVVISTATMAVIVNALRLVRENSDRVMAASIARSQVEYLQSLGTTAIPIGLTVGAVPPGQSATRVDARLLDSKFTIRTTANWVGLNQTSSACEAASPGRAYLRVSVEVSSQNLATPAKADTVIVPPATSTTPTGTGSAAISIGNQVGSPVSDVIVRGTDAFKPANNFTLTTGSDGCLFLPSLQPSGSLVVSVSRAGYVSQTPTGTTATLQITAGNVSRSAFKLAAAASLDFTSTDTAFPLPAAMPVTWQFNTTGASATTSVAGTPVTGLWPETSGVSAFAGTCADADPRAYDLTLQSFTLDAGGLTVAPLASLPVRLRGLPANTPVTLRYTGTDTACTLTTLLAGTSNDVGVLRLSLPYGTWSFTAAGQTQALTAPLVPLPAGTDPTPVVVGFTLANLDGLCPSASPSPTGTSTASLTPTVTDSSASPSPIPSGCPTPTPTATATP